MFKRALAAASALVVGVTSAQAATDFSALTSAVSFTDVLAAVASIAAVIAVFYVGRNGFMSVLTLIRGKTK